VESFAFHNGVRRIYPVADIQEAYRMRELDPTLLLAGERGGRKAEGFDFGNSPSQIEHVDLTGRDMIHTTSAGTQGVIAAKKADVILLGALVNARATAEYIKQLGAERVSLVCMGKENRHPIEEDTYCAEYIRSILEGTGFDKESVVADLRQGEGSRFFIPEDQSFAPERDFYLCTDFDRFDFALRVFRDEQGRDYTARVTL